MLYCEGGRRRKASDHHRPLQRAGRGRADPDRRARERDPEVRARGARAAPPARHAQGQGVPRTSIGNPKILTNPELPARGPVTETAASARISKSLDNWPPVRNHASGYMSHIPESPPSGGRRRALVLFVNTAVALIGGGLSAVLGAFAFGPGRARSAGTLVRAGTTDDLEAGRAGRARAFGVARGRLVSRARARNRVSRLGRRSRRFARCRRRAPILAARFDGMAKDKKFRCPCHGGVYAADGTRARGTAAAAARRSKRASIRRIRRCWCGCEAPLRVAARPHRVSRRRPRHARRAAAAGHRLVLHARQRAARAALDPAPDRARF